MTNNLSPIRIGGVPEHFNFPWQIWLKDTQKQTEGPEWIWQDFPGGSGAMIQSVLEDKLDLALVLTEAAANAIMQGNEITAVSVYVQSPLVWGIFSGAKNPIQEVDPVAEKKYAISRFGSGSHLMAKLDAKFRGQSIEKSQFLEVQNLDGAKRALENLEADLFFWEKWMTKPLVDQGIFKILGQRPTPWPCFVLICKPTFWEKEETKKYVRDAFEEVLKIAQDLKKDPTGFQKIAGAYGLKEEDAKVWLEQVSWSSEWKNPKNEINEARKALNQLS